MVGPLANSPRCRHDDSVTRPEAPQNPPTTRRDDLVEMIHGRVVADPYRWLEDADDPAVKSWVDAQNALTRNVLDALSERQSIRERLGELLSIGHLSRPVVRRRSDGGYSYFTVRRDAGEDQMKVVVRSALNGVDRVLVDPSRLGDSNTMALDWHYPSPDGSLLAYGLSEGGSERSTLRVIEVPGGRQVGPTIDRTRACSIAWLPDSSGFFFTRLPAAGSVPKGEEQYHQALYRYQLGTDPESAQLVFLPDAMNDSVACSLSPKGDWLAITIFGSWSKGQLWLAPVRDGVPGKCRRCSPKGEALYYPVVLDDRVFVLTNERASRYRVLSFRPETPSRDTWVEVVGQHTSDVLDDIAVVGGQLLVAWQREGRSRLERFDLDGSRLGEVELPAPGTSNGFSGHHEATEAFYDFESFVHAPIVYRIDLGTGIAKPWQQVASSVDPEHYSITAEQATSADGTSIPYVVVHHRDTPLDTPTKTLLYAYGGFHYSLRPRFSRTNLLWIERGGVYVQANVRGGGERGEDWHRAGKGANKQNTFDDLVAVAEDLSRRGVTQPGRLAIHGRSNGGLLVAAAITQRPDLFGAAICGVPLADMLRYPRFLVGRFWIPEYGDPDDPQQFEWLHAYSPYHRVRFGALYPPTLVMTAAGDSRVDPLHARKLVAALQAATSAQGPILLRTEVDAGHGAGKPISKQIEEFADIFAFLDWQLA